MMRCQLPPASVDVLLLSRGPVSAVMPKHSCTNSAQRPRVLYWSVSGRASGGAAPEVGNNRPQGKALRWGCTALKFWLKLPLGRGFLAAALIQLL